VTLRFTGDTLSQSSSNSAAVRSRGFLRYLLRPAHLVVVLGVMGAGQLIEHLGWLDSSNAALLDSFYILTHRDIASKVAIVDITEDDYKQLFRETSPLDPKLLKGLVDTIAVFRPLAIGVDIDTSAAGFQRLEARSGRPPVVWAVAARQQLSSGTWQRLHGREPELMLDPVLGKPWTESLRTGLSIFLLDPDNTVRRYSRSYRVSAPSGQPRDLETLPAAVAHAALGKPSEETESRSVLIRFPRPPSAAARLPASFVLHASSEHARQPGQPWPRLLNLLTDRVVLVGGTYSAARDSLTTPYGAMSGLDVIAAAAATELAGGGMDEVERAVMLLLDVALAVLLIYLGYALSVRGMLLCGGAAIAAVTLFSFFAFSSGLFWLNTTPLLLAVMLHQWVHRAAERRHQPPSAPINPSASR
jgi:CHASE2 domain-containing sensor protein